MIFWTEESTTIASADEAKRKTLEYRRLIFFILLSINICSQVSSFGVFQINFTSLTNDKGRDSQGRCCGGGGDAIPLAAAETDGSDAATAADDACSRPCRTFFTVCLRHYQENLPTSDVECTFGENTTDVIALNSFNRSESESAVNNTVSIHLDFAWPSSFSLFVKAWHDATGIGPSKGSDRILIAEFAIKRNLTVSEEWRHDVYLAGRIRLGYAYRVICSKNFIGPGCSDKCTPRNDKHGHYNCSPNGSKLCLPGWTGEYCLAAICLDGCNTTNGFCDEPFECKCRGGWKGQLCNECMPHPNCSHGDCNDKHQCNCFEGWGGLHCDEDLNYCTNHEPCKNGATCKNTGEGSYTCLCPLGFTGTNCETEIFDCHKNVCVNGGVCKMKSDGHRICHCPSGFSGSNCEVDVIKENECAAAPCVNDGRCINEDGGYRCVCAPGFTGARCEQDFDHVKDGDCLRDPCLNGGTCSRSRCRCSPGFTGDRCQYNIDDCASHPCANDATCVDRVNAFSCLCAPGFTGPHCADQIDECQSRPCGARGMCIDLVNGYRCICEGGFAATNCEEAEMTTSDDDVHVSPETDVPPTTTDSYLRQVMLVVCLGLLLILLVICLAVVVFVLHRRRRRFRRRRVPSVPSNGLKQKMNNITASEEQGGGGGGGYYEKQKSKGDAGPLEGLKSQQHLQFAVREGVQVQRNINDANNLKNVEKCSNRKQKVLDWNNAGLESNTAKSIDHACSPESKSNLDQTNETNAWKQSDGTLSKRGPSNVISGTQGYFRPGQTLFNEKSIATEV